MPVFIFFPLVMSVISDGTDNHNQSKIFSRFFFIFPIIFPLFDDFSKFATLFTLKNFKTRKNKLAKNEQIFWFNI